MKLQFPNAIRHAQNKTLSLLRCSAEVVTSRFGDGRKGGYLCMLEGNGRKAVNAFFGAPATNKAEQYAFFAEEKCRRLQLFFTKDMLSYQSMAPERGQFQGGIRLVSSECIVAISGLPPAVDEAYVAAVATRVGWEDEEYFRDLMLISQNTENYEAILAMLPSR